MNRSFGSLWWRKKLAALLAACLLTAAFLAANPLKAQAAPEQPRRFIAIAYDDSGSMRYNDKNRDIYKNYIFANYSLQNLVALMEKRDSAKIYLISKKGRNPIAVSRSKDLYQAMKNIGANPSGDTYAETLYQAMIDGVAFLKANPDREFMFVTITDGLTMYNEKGAEIHGSLQSVFKSYLKKSGLGDYASRTRALLLSIGTDKPLAPVSDLQSVLRKAGIPTDVFTADVTGEKAAGEHIMAAMTDLAEAMASTNMMAIEPGKPFTIRYPLESLVIMEQFQQTSESTVKSIEGGDVSLIRNTLFSTRAIGGVKLASTFSAVKASAGSIKPGQYTIKTTGSARLMAFSKVGFTTSVELIDGRGKQVALFQGSRWSVDGLELAMGERLDARVTFHALDGSPVELDSHVRIGFGSPEILACEVMGQGAFRVKAVKHGQEFLTIELVDPEFFQISLPALRILVPEPQATESARPGPSATAGAQTADQAARPSPAPAEEVLDNAGLLNAAGRMFPVPYTFSGEFEKVASLSIGGVLLQESDVSFSAIPEGLQVRFNSVEFDSKRLSGIVAVAEENSLELWADRRFAEAGDRFFTMTVGGGQQLTLGVKPVPRQVKVVITPERLEFGVLDRRGAFTSGYRVLIRQGDEWVELADGQMEMGLTGPDSLAFAIDRGARQISVRPSWLAALTPVGRTELVLSAGTGKPGESAQAALEVKVNDDWRKWLLPGAVLALLLIIGAYALALALKKRIPLQTKALVSANPDMSGSEPAEIIRRKLKRNLWPFGREVCAIGLLELYPHPKRRDRVILSSVAVQYGLLLNGRPPQHHKDRDEAGDFILSSNTVAGVRVNGEYRYYQFPYHGKWVEKFKPEKRDIATKG